MNELKRKYIPLRELSILSLTVAMSLGTVLKVLPAPAKPINTDEGQAKLMREVNAGQQSHQLTLKEANRLRKDLAQVARKKAKMLAKNRKLSVEDVAKLKSDVNEISENIHRLELEKRAQSH